VADEFLFHLTDHRPAEAEQAEAKEINHDLFDPIARRRRHRHVILVPAISFWLSRLSQGLIEDPSPISPHHHSPKNE